MFRQSSFRKSVALTVVLLLAATSPALALQKKSKKEKAAPAGTPVLWKAPKDIAARDLFWGPGGETGAPDTRRVTFIKQEQGGFSTKYRVRDASGREWVAKIGKEAQSETAAVRLVWAAGYMTEINYLVPRVTIEGKGEFENVRFEARPDSVERLDEWKWKENPFNRTKEFHGLLVMMALLNNWDLKDSNNKILQARDEATGRDELRYIISDLGATFGKSGGIPVIWRITRNRNEPESFARTAFVEEVKNGLVYLKYGGKNQDLFDFIPAENAKWIGEWLSRLSDRQLGDAFRAANYTPEEIQILTGAVRERINELAGLPVPVSSR